MLKEFSIKNYKSINEEVTFSMEADVDRVSENPSHIIHLRDNALLRVGSMYGPNGGGKSNILKAIYLLRSIITNGPLFDASDDCSCAFSDDPLCEFVVFFATDKFDIGYKIRFSIVWNSDFDEEGPIRPAPHFEAAIDSESVHVFDDAAGEYKEICERNAKGEITANDSIISKLIYDKAIGQSTSILRFFYQFFYNEEVDSPMPLEIIFDLYKEISSFVMLRGDLPRNYPRPLSSFYAESVLEHKEELIRMLDAADIRIKNIVVEKGDPRSRIFFVRDFDSGNGIIEKSIDLSEESSGTQKLFDMLLMFLRRKRRDTVFLGDDINAYLHPKLLAAILDLFNSGRMGNSQLIFNSHDIVNMNNRVFRRDEIWFVYRDEKYQTNIIPLSNITNYKGKQIRNDASYGKQYLEGKYGADPFIQKGLNWDE